MMHTACVCELPACEFSRCAVHAPWEMMSSDISGKVCALAFPDVRQPPGTTAPSTQHTSSDTDHTCWLLRVGRCHRHGPQAACAACRMFAACIHDADTCAVDVESQCRQFDAEYHGTRSLRAIARVLGFTRTWRIHLNYPRRRVGCQIWCRFWHPKTGPF